MYKIEVLEDLVNHSELSGLDYVPNLIEGIDPRGIDVGLLTRADRVEVVDLQQKQAENPLVEYFFDRIDFEDKLILDAGTGPGQTIEWLVNKLIESGKSSRIISVDIRQEAQ